jgi:hypothetical protein
MLSIERGAAMADLIALLEQDPTTSPKINTHYVARIQARNGLAWTWRRPDGTVAVCAGLMPMARTEPVGGREFEAWFSCRALESAELLDFLRFAHLTLLCVAHDGPHDTFALVQPGRSMGARIASLIGFAFWKRSAGVDVWRWCSTERMGEWAA